MVLPILAVELFAQIFDQMENPKEIAGSKGEYPATAFCNPSTQGRVRLEGDRPIAWSSCSAAVPVMTRARGNCVVG